MKKIIILATILLVFTTTGLGQAFNQTCRDTIYGISPDYFNFFDPDAWLDSPDTTVTVIDLIEIDRYYDSVSETWVSVMGYGPVKIPVQFELMHSVASKCNPTEPEKEVWYQHTDRPIIVKGLAGVITPHFNTPDYSMDEHWSHFCDLPPDTCEHLYLYDARPDTFICMQDIIWQIDTPCKYLKRRMRHYPNVEYGCCYRIADTIDVFPLREFYFDTPTLVKDSFYIGFSSISANYTRRPNWPDTEYVSAYYQRFHFGTRETPECPCLVYHKKCMEFRDCQYYNTVAFQWYDYDTEYKTDYPMLWAIYEDACPQVTEIHADRIDAHTTTLSWLTSQYSTQWDLLYGPEGTPDDSCRWVSCSRPTYTITHLDSSITYKVKLRAQCHIDTLYYSEWDSIRIENGSILSIPQTTSEELKITLIPNPAKDEVTILASATMKHIELFSLNGNSILESNVDDLRAILRLKSIAPGSYIVRVLTDKGMASKKLIVR